MSKMSLVKSNIKKRGKNMIKNTQPKKQTARQTTMFGTYKFPSYEEIM
ncbi:unnamed protein product, partial [marine sediment metagenome]